MSFSEVNIKVINSSANPLPEYATPSAAGMDLRASLAEAIEVLPGARVLVPTGLRVEIPDGYEMQLRPRSGLALRQGISLVNTPGTIDADYRGEIGVILINFGQDKFVIQPGDRICQAVISPVVHAVWCPADGLSDSERDSGGFGHSGIK